MYRLAEARIKRLSVAGDETLLQGGSKGLEKESLRISRDGSVATTPHPEAWGSPLTHPYITTDYSEALTELVTPAYGSIEEMLRCLDRLHRYLYENLNTGELLWAASMPCAVGDDQAIPIAEYGASNIGRMKHIYRVGLDYRYGRRMQAIAGVHFNYSLPTDFWPVFQEEEKDTGPLRDFVDDHYFGMIRNFHRLGWLVPFLFGNSPAVCKSFLAGRTTRFKAFDTGTHYLPFATSLRMSDIGYKNKNQSALAISYDNLDGYVDSLRAAIETPYPEYEAIGTRDGDRYIQINTNVLQIENEYYSFVRPKRVTRAYEKPSVALRDRGVEYVEIRALDVNAFDPNGANVDELRFLEAFLIFCLLEHSPSISAAEQRTIQYNELTIALRGREPGLLLQFKNGMKTLKSWTTEIFDGVEVICAALDSGRPDPVYKHALDRQRANLEDYDLLPSARVLAAMRELKLPFAKYTFALSESHEHYFRGRPLDADKATEFQTLAADSIRRQKEIEANDDIDIDEFLRRYFNETLN
jgi:glutamate--cysteine ligase